MPPQEQAAILKEQAALRRSKQPSRRAHFQKQVITSKSSPIVPTPSTTHSVPSSLAPSMEGKARSLAIIGGGAAGFFLAINAKELLPSLYVTIFEQQDRPLKKVEISGGGRCNCTNTFAQVTDLGQVYPRGSKLLKRLFKQFGPKDAYRWFEEHGVPLVVQSDECIFPEAQDSHAIIDCFLYEARRHAIEVKTRAKVTDAETLFDHYDYVAVTTGGISRSSLLTPTYGRNTPITPLAPSLFTFNIKDETLHELMGTVVEHAIVSIPSTKFRVQDPLLITHWGMSGPAVLKLSSHASTHLAANNYRSPILVNWTGETNADTVLSHLTDLLAASSGKLIDNIHAFHLQSRLWIYLLYKSQLQGRRCREIGKKGLNRLVNILTNDLYHIDSRCQYKDEFVTCGGVDLSSVDKATLESKLRPGLFFAGEVLDIDGVTGGFNFQAAWTTAYAVAKAIADREIINHSE